MAGPANRRAGTGETRPKIRRLHPVRVLLVLRDRRLLRVTSFLLERRGYDVIRESGTNIADSAARFRADVVLLQAESSRAATGRSLAALEALRNPPGVVAVCADGEGEHLPGIIALSKWAPIEDVARAIDAAALRRG